jgi:CheY-like chemotaxis protein
VEEGNGEEAVDVLAKQAIDVLDAVQKGASGYIRKPFTAVQIRSQLSSLLKAAGT